jgi:hypothetical protein
MARKTTAKTISTIQSILMNGFSEKGVEKARKMGPIPAS